MERFAVTDLLQIVPAAARLESVGSTTAARIRAGIIDLLADTCDVATLTGARVRLLQQVGEDEDLCAAETRLVDDAIRRATMRATTTPLATDNSSVDSAEAVPLIGA